jgi:hypothetical protein
MRVCLQEHHAAVLREELLLQSSRQLTLQSLLDFICYLACPRGCVVCVVCCACELCPQNFCYDLPCSTGLEPADMLVQLQQMRCCDAHAGLQGTCCELLERAQHRSNIRPYLFEKEGPSGCSEARTGPAAGATAVDAIVLLLPC